MKLVLYESPASLYKNQCNVPAAMPQLASSDFITTSGSVWLSLHIFLLFSLLFLVC